MLRQGDAQVLKKYSKMKLQMKREALVKLNRQANEMAEALCQNLPLSEGSGTVMAERGGFDGRNGWRCFRIRASSDERP
jgi:hypothetical protein